ncbi:MAG: hypothetical protein E3J72_18445 [Planctomycetota bacterium]|nr:MAG: hypothetical protein E3J72_18445 [Planctomycetota bacterium]
MSCNGKKTHPEPDFSGLDNISRRLWELKKEKRKLSRGSIPNSFALQEVQKKINELLKKKALAEEETRLRIRQVLGREDRQSLTATLPHFYAAFFTNSGDRLDVTLKNARRIIISYYGNGKLDHVTERGPAGRYRDFAALIISLTNVNVVFAKRISKKEQAALESAGILAIQTREAGFQEAIERHSDQIQFFLEG